MWNKNFISDYDELDENGGIDEFDEFDYDDDMDEQEYDEQEY